MALGTRIQLFSFRLRSRVRKARHAGGHRAVGVGGDPIEACSERAPAGSVAQASEYVPAPMPTPARGASIEPVGEREIRRQVVAFLDRVEARERLAGRPRAGESPLDAAWTPGEARLVRDAQLEAARLLEAARVDARELVREARGEAEQTLEWSRSRGAEIIRRSQRLAADRFGQDGRSWITAEPPIS